MTVAESPVYAGNRPRNALALREWHARAPQEQALEPALPIVDAHHHLYGTPEDDQFYLLEEFTRDLESSGHNVVGTIWVEAYESGWHADGPEELRSVGEVEGIVRAASTPVAGARGACEVAAGIVSNVDLTLGNRVAEVLEAHAGAARGRLRGVRHHATYDEGTVGHFLKGPPRRFLLADSRFRRGFACLEGAGLAFDALIFHTQLGELAELADAFPRTTIVLNHVGVVIGVAEYASRRAVEFEQWSRMMVALAARPNVRVKLGGMGMPVFGFGFEGASAPAASAELLWAWQPCLDVCLEAFGTQRCMFESNFPVDKQSCGYAELWNAFKLATRALSPDERRDLFYRTACHTYRLPELERACDESLNSLSGDPGVRAAVIEAPPQSPVRA